MQAITLRMSPHWRRYQMMMFLFAYVSVAAFALQDYVQVTSLSFLAGLFAFPFVVRISGKVLDRGLLLLTCLAAFCCFLLPFQTFLYFLLGSSMMLLGASLGCYAGLKGWLLLFAMSPASIYAEQVIGLPVRMQLSQWAGQILQQVIPGIRVEGAALFLGGNEFAVDPACMGLNMLMTSFIISIMLIGHHEQQYRSRTRVVLLFGYLAFVCCFAVASNMIRILLLIRFLILPGNIFHDWIGIACLVVYVALPAFFLARFIARRSPVYNPKHTTATCDGYFMVHLSVFLICVLATWKVRSAPSYSQVTIPPRVAGYRSSVLAPGNIKLENANSLVYIKIIRGFYDTDHNPMFCWKGSGYTLHAPKIEILGGRKVYTAALHKDKAVLHTAWWYGNAELQTTSQLAWRWNMLRSGTPHALVNVTAASRSALKEAVEFVLVKERLSETFGRQPQGNAGTNNYKSIVKSR